MRRALLLGLVLLAACDDKPSPAAVHPIPKEMQDELMKLTGRKFEDKDNRLGGGTWTVRGSGYGSKGFGVMLTKDKLTADVTVYTEGDAADFHRLVTGTPHAAWKGEPSVQYLAEFKPYTVGP